MSETIPTERLQEILAATEGVTPGPWESDFSDVLECSQGAWRQLLSVVDRGDDASLLTTSHLANCDPQTIASMASELLDLRKKLDWLTADYWYDADDPDNADPDTPFNIAQYYGNCVIVKVYAAANLGPRWGFILPAEDGAENDDEREFWFDTQEEARAQLRALSHPEKEPSNG